MCGHLAVSEFGSPTLILFSLFFLERPGKESAILRRGGVGAYKVQAYPREQGRLEGTSPKLSVEQTRQSP